MTRGPLSRWLLLLLAALLLAPIAACNTLYDRDELSLSACTSDVECSDGLACVAGVCRTRTASTCEPACGADALCLISGDSAPFCAEAEDRFALVEPGRFTLGSPENEPQRSADETRHEVTLTRPFVVAVTEVSQAEWSEHFPNNPSASVAPGLPVERVSWFEALAYANARSAAAGLPVCYDLGSCTGTVGTANYGCSMPIAAQPTCTGYRLLTEAEWEVAARASTSSAWFCGESSACVDDIAWIGTNSGGATHPVGEKMANGFGLLDTSGNVQEWVFDTYGGYPGEAVTDPVGPTSGTQRVTRGGAFNAAAGATRSAARQPVVPSSREPYLGFRIARTVFPPGS